MSDAYRIIYGQGPQFLNNVPDGIAWGGLAVGSGLLASGQEEFGLPIITSSFTLSTRLDMAATALTGIDYIFNRNDAKLNSFNYQFQRLYQGGAFGEVIERVAGTVGIYYPIFRPYIF